MGDKLYKKLGNKYVRVPDDEYVSHLKNGFYLIHAYDYGRSTERIEPDLAAVKAAMILSKEAMILAMQMASYPKPGNGLKPFSQKEKKAFDAYKKIMGEDSMCIFTKPALQDIVQAGLNALEHFVKPSNEQPPF